MAKRLFEADIEAPSFVKKGGLATQYLKADGSVSTDSNAQLGANLFPYRIKTTITGVDPTAGHIAYDFVTQIDSTKLFFSYLVEDGFDVKLFFEDFNVGDKLIIQDKDDSSNNQIWQISTLTFNTAYIQLNVTLISSSGTGTTNFANNHEVFVVRQAVASGGGSSTWGAITGTLSSQTDLQNALNAKVDKIITTNRQTASYTLALTDANKLVEMNVATANNLTVPPNASVAFPIGTPIDISQYGAGITTIVAGSGVTIRSANNWFKMNAQYAGASIVKIGTNEWYLFGNLNA